MKEFSVFFGNFYIANLIIGYFRNEDRTDGGMLKVFLGDRLSGEGRARNCPVSHLEPGERDNKK